MLEMKAYFARLRKQVQLYHIYCNTVYCLFYFCTFLFYFCTFLLIWVIDRTWQESVNFRLDNIKCRKKTLILVCSYYSQYNSSCFYFDSLYRSTVSDWRYFKIFWTFLCGNIGRVQRNCYIYNDDNRNNEWSILFNM